MRKQLTLALLAFTLVASAAPKQLQYKTDVVVDGQYTEWAFPLPRTNSATGINYDIANDNKNLYIFVRCTNTMTQNQIVSSGFEIWVNVNGKKKKVTGINYPIPVEKEDAPTTAAAGAAGAPAGVPAGGPPAGMGGFPGGMGGFPGGMGGGRQGGMGGGRQGGSRASFGSFSLGNNSFVVSRDMILQGFLIPNGQQPAKGTDIKIGLTLDQDGFMMYELAIPFNTFFKESLDPVDDAKMKIAVGFVVKKQVLDQETNSMMRNMRSMSAMYGGMGGGMMMGGMNSMTQEKKFWVVAKPTIK